MFPTSEKTELNWWRDGAMPVKFVKVWYLKLSWNWLKHMLRDGAWYEAVRLEIFVHKKRGNFSRKRQCWNRWLVVLISSHVRNCSSVENYSNVWVYIIWNPITIVWGACLGLDIFVWFDNVKDGFLRACDDVFGNSILSDRREIWNKIRGKRRVRLRLISWEMKLPNSFRQFTNHLNMRWVQCFDYCSKYVQYCTKYSQ